MTIILVINKENKRMIYEKIKFNTEQESVRQIRIFNYPVVEYYKRHGEKKKHYSIIACT